MIYAFRAEASLWLFPILTLLAIQSIPHALRMSTKVLYNIDHIQIDAIAYILYFQTNRGLTDRNKVQYSMTDKIADFLERTVCGSAASTTKIMNTIVSHSKLIY